MHKHNKTQLKHSQTHEQSLKQTLSHLVTQRDLNQSSQLTRLVRSSFTTVVRRVDVTWVASNDGGAV
jgi:hypothetical protein